MYSVKDFKWTWNMDFVAAEYALISARGIHRNLFKMFPDCLHPQTDKDRGECM